MKWIGLDRLIAIATTLRQYKYRKQGLKINETDLVSFSHITPQAIFILIQKSNNYFPYWIAAFRNWISHAMKSAHWNYFTIVFLVALTKEN